jgi:hypothetical protein
MKGHPTAMPEAEKDEYRQAVLALLRHIARRPVTAPSIYDPGQPLHDLKKAS